MILGQVEIWHASLVELVWLLLGCVGVYFGWANLRDSKRDLDALHTLNGGNLAKYQIMQLIAYGHYRNNLFRLAKFCTVLAIGLIASVLPPTKPGSTNGPIVGVVITGGLFTIVLLLVMSSILDRRQRDAIKEIDELGEGGTK